MSKNKVKENGVVYTPTWIVNEILDLSKFTANIHDKKVMEPGCGDGAFLTEIVRRVIADAKNAGVSSEKISSLLDANIFGVDIDEVAIDKCKSKLNDICQKYQVLAPSWSNIKVVNLLSKKVIEEYKGCFDFVFGNPPYVRIQNLSKEARKFINENLKICKHGSTDLYIAFFELGHIFLNDNGVLGYITPNTFLSSAAGKELRNFLQGKAKILVDFEHHQVFEDATTYSLITILEKFFSGDKVDLYKGNDKSIRNEGDLSIQRFGSEHWILEKEDILNKIDAIKKIGKPLHEIAKIHTGLATLKDDIFIVKKPLINGNTVSFTRNYVKEKDGKEVEVSKIVEIEKGILKKIIKASTWKGSNDNQDLFVIFPYKKVGDGYEIIPEDELGRKYPLTLKYFQSVKHELKQRDKGDKKKLDKYPAWYAFGRSQGIDTAFGKKIITAAINLKPRFLVCEDDDTTYYAGYSVHYDGDLHKLADKLNSDNMEYFIKYTSRDYQGAYKSYSKSSIEDFGVDI
jgi:adenine-specific DNA-methyltransferase